MGGELFLQLLSSEKGKKMRANIDSSGIEMFYDRDTSSYWLTNANVWAFCKAYHIQQASYIMTTEFNRRVPLHNLFLFLIPTNYLQ